MTTITVSRYDDAFATLRVRDLAQALYDEGAVIMEGVLLTLHGKAHRDRRRLENRVFRREIFRYYEREVIPRTIERSIAPFVARGHADLVALGYRVTMNLTADFAGIDRPNQTSEETEALLALVVKFSEGATLVHSTRDHEQVRAEVRDALGEFDRIFLQPSIARRRELLIGGPDRSHDASTTSRSGSAWPRRRAFPALPVAGRRSERIAMSGGGPPASRPDGALPD